MFVSSLPTTPEARFASIIDLLCRTVAAQIAGRRLEGPFIILIWRRLRRLGTRFAALAARVAAGRLRPARPRPCVPRQRPPAAPSPLPRGRAWLMRLVPEAAGAASQLQHLLTDPEMAALIAAAPQAGRILRPLCRMLGIDPPAALRLPPPAGRPTTSRRAASAPLGPAPAPLEPPPRPRPPTPARASLPRACGPPRSAT